MVPGRCDIALPLRAIRFTSDANVCKSLGGTGVYSGTAGLYSIIMDIRVKGKVQKNENQIPTKHWLFVFELFKIKSHFSYRQFPVRSQHGWGDGI